MASARVVGLTAAALVAILGVLTQWRPFVTVERDVITATPSLAGIFQRDVVELRRGESACVAPVRFSPDTRRLALLAVAPLGTGQATVAARASDGSWRTSVRAARFGAKVDGPLQVRLPAAPPRDLVGRVCVRNDGPTPFGLVGTAEGRSDAPAVTTVDGEARPDVALTLLEERPASLLSRTGEVLGHASTLTSGLVPTFVLWLVSVGLLLATLAGIPYALWAAVRDDDVR